MARRRDAPRPSIPATASQLPADSLVATVKRALAVLARPRRCWVAYSGGLDSHVLLHLACRALADDAAPPRAVHVNHGISPHAERWQRRCERVCADWGVPLRVERVAVTAVGAGLEAAARAERYRAFERCVKAGDALLLAHHLDDQAETVLLRLLRGAGAAGIAGMPARRALGAGTLLRPLLSVARGELERYAESQRLAWIEDESNLSSTPDRNYLRHRVLPAVRERWPAYRATLFRAGELCRRSARIDADVAAADCAAARRGDGLSIAALRALSAPRRANALRRWLGEHSAPAPSFAQLEAIDAGLVSAAEDATPCVRWGGAVLRRHRGALYSMPPLDAPSAGGSLSWDPSCPLRMSGAGALRARAVTGSGLRRRDGERLEVRFRVGGERCRPSRCAERAGARRTRPLKKLLQERGVPVWLRDRVPLLFSGGRLAAVADLWQCEGFSAGPAEAGWRIRWQPPLPFPGHR